MRCDECFFWEDPEDMAGSGSHEDDFEGRCRRHAPAPISSSQIDVFRSLGLFTELAGTVVDFLKLDIAVPDPPIGADDASTYFMWPRTHGGDWCGEFRAREQVENRETE